LQALYRHGSGLIQGSAAKKKRNECRKTFCLQKRGERKEKHPWVWGLGPTPERSMPQGAKEKTTERPSPGSQNREGKATRWRKNRRASARGIRSRGGGSAKKGGGEKGGKCTRQSSGNAVRGRKKNGYHEFRPDVERKRGFLAGGGVSIGGRGKGKKGQGELPDFSSTSAKKGTGSFLVAVPAGPTRMTTTDHRGGRLRARLKKGEGKKRDKDRGMT